MRCGGSPIQPEMVGRSLLPAGYALLLRGNVN
jgi:hypothetical protein